MHGHPHLAWIDPQTLAMRTAQAREAFAAAEVDQQYLAHHLPRFLYTFSEFDHSWDRELGDRVLDIGAHWLHQSVIWRRAGYRVTALDLGLTLELEVVKNLARTEGIALLVENDLASARALGTLPDDSIDIILFTEIIEHITFNPVAFWTQVYRVLAPGGRLIVTTPNYYFVKGRAWQWRRFVRGFGGGISVGEVLATHTYGHHWREYSLRELVRYFCLLSPDFSTVKAFTVPSINARLDNRTRCGRAAQRFSRHAGWLFDPNLYLEVALDRKERGVVIQPSW